MDQATNQKPIKKMSPTQMWMILIVAIVLLGGLIAFVMSSKLGSEEVGEVYGGESDEISEIPFAKPPVTTPVTQQKPTPVPVTPKPATTPVATQPGQKSVFKDGTYSADGKYFAPSGLEPMGVSITLKNDLVTNVQIGLNAHNGTSYRYQEVFGQSVSSYVVGKRLDQIQLDVVSGASLTTGGFMNALQSIKSQAKA